MIEERVVGKLKGEGGEREKEGERKGRETERGVACEQEEGGRGGRN